MSPSMTQEASSLLAAYEEAGWTHRWGSKNHIVCYSPDGKITHGIPPTIFGKTARQRMRALEKWKEEHPMEAVQTLDAPGEPPPEVPTVVHQTRLKSDKDGKVRVILQLLSNDAKRYACAECEWIGQTYRSVAQHFGSAHTNPSTGPFPRSPKPPVEVAQEPVEQDDAALLAQIRHLLGSTPEAEVTQLRAESAALRSELEAMRAERQALRDLLE